MSLFASGAATLPISDAVLDSAARTTTNNSPNFSTLGARGVIIYINATAIAATPSVVFTIQGYDAVSNTYYDILASAAVTSVSAVRLQVSPDLVAAANTKANDLLPDVIRVRAVHGDADSITYSVSACLVP
jgi:hypothetical protein